MDLQMRAAAQNSAVQWANSLMQQGISAAMLEDAINALLVKLKEQILIDTISQQMEAQQSMQEGGEDAGQQWESDESNGESADGTE